MGAWPDLRVDPQPRLLASGHEALVYMARRDLLGEDVGPAEDLWALAEAQGLLRKQQADGSWRYPGQNRARFPEINYDLLETFKSLGRLVSMYAFDRRHPAIERAADYVFACQTGAGDVRGILGTQTMPYYHSVILELLIQAGFAGDPRIEEGIEWLLSVRQEDGGWLIPMQAVPAREKTREIWSGPPVRPDRSLPHAHLATGMALRALVVHPRHRHRPEVRAAAQRLKARFFQADRYNDRKAPAYWTKFQFPFWWSNLLTALDSLSLIGWPVDDGDVQAGLAWFLEHQQADGLWPTGYENPKREELSPKEVEARLWVGLAVCRVFRRFHDTPASARRP